MARDVFWVKMSQRAVHVEYIEINKECGFVWARGESINAIWII